MTPRICIECDHRWTGALPCPECGAPGQPLPGRPAGRTNYDAARCIWAALRAQELITVQEASDYRNGRRKPYRALRDAWRRLGYDVEAMEWPERES